MHGSNPIQVDLGTAHTRWDEPPEQKMRSVSVLIVWSGWILSPLDSRDREQTQRTAIGSSTRGVPSPRLAKRCWPPCRGPVRRVLCPRPSGNVGTPGGVTYRPAVFRARHLELAVGDRTLIRDLSFELAPGQIVAVTGPSGSGKSTLLRGLCWLHPLAHGALDLDGKRVAEWGVCEWRRRIAYVPQQTPQLPDTAEAYLMRASQFGVQRRGAAPSARLEHAKRVGQSWNVDDAHWDAPFATLSGGERQRLYLAIVLATTPDVLLLDEPTSALDHETKLLVERELQQHTALWVTHDHEQAVRVGDNRMELPG